MTDEERAAELFDWLAQYTSARQFGAAGLERAECLGLMARYDRKPDGDLLISFDLASKQVSIQTRPPRCDHCRAVMGRTPYGFLCLNCSHSYDSPPDA